MKRESVKMPTRLHGSEKKVLAVELAVLVVCAVLCVYGVYAIIHGSLIAVVLSLVPALIMCKAGEDMQRIIEEAQRRDGNA